MNVSYESMFGVAECKGIKIRLERDGRHLLR
jgi:hypothetical protein